MSESSPQTVARKAAPPRARHFARRTWRIAEFTVRPGDYSKIAQHQTVRVVDQMLFPAETDGRWQCQSREIRAILQIPARFVSITTAQAQSSAKR
jgi:hypothetical protein